MNYLALLEHSFELEKALGECPPKSRFAYLSGSIFDFTTYDGELDDLFGRRAVEVCAAINTQTTFDYIESPEQYQWFITMCNMPFFQGRLEWGTSIRGAWWSVPSNQERMKLSSCGLWAGDEQLTDMTFTLDEWKSFIGAVVSFAAGD